MKSIIECKYFVIFKMLLLSTVQALSMIMSLRLLIYIFQMTATFTFNYVIIKSNVNKFF